MSDKIVAHQHVLEDGSISWHTHIQKHTHTQKHIHKEKPYKQECIDEEAEQRIEDIHQDSHHLHGHTHTHENTKAVLNRLSKVIGHLESIKRMVESGRDCSEVLVQLAAVKSAINSTGKVILKDHIEHCIVDAVREQDMEVLEELNKAIDRFMK